jgi:hypothetical protein
MLPPASARPSVGVATAHARTASAGPSAVRRTGPSPAPSTTSNGKESSNPAASTAAARRASAAPRLGAPISTGVRRALPGTGAPAAAARPGHTRQSMSVSSAPRAAVGTMRSVDRAPLSKTLGPGVKTAVAGAKPGRQELEDKVHMHFQLVMAIGAER